MKNTAQIAKEISQILPTFLRHMYPYVFQPIPVPPSQVLALVTIEEKGTCSLGKLGKEMHVSAPTISGIVDRLEKGGYIKRLADKKDRRVTHIILTHKGKKVVQHFRENIMTRWQYILKNLPAEMQEGPLFMLRQITQRFIDGII